MSRVRSSRARTAGADQPSRKGASRADHTGTKSSSSIVPDTTRRAVTGPIRSRQTNPAPLARQGPSLIRWIRVLPSLTDVASAVPAQDGRSCSQGARGTVQIRRVAASDTPGEQVVLARAAHDAGPPRWTPPPGDARAVQPVPRERRRESPLAALGLHAAVAKGRGLTRHTRAVVDPPVAPRAIALGVVHRLGRGDRIHHATLHRPSPNTKRIRGAVLAEVVHPAIHARIPVPGVAVAVLHAPGHPTRGRVHWAGPIRVVEAKLPSKAQPAVPATQRIPPMELLVVSWITDAFRDIPRILLGVRVVRAIAVGHVV